MAACVAFVRVSVGKAREYVKLFRIGILMRRWRIGCPQSPPGSKRTIGHKRLPGELTRLVHVPVFVMRTTAAPTKRPLVRIHRPVFQREGVAGFASPIFCQIIKIVDSFMVRRIALERPFGDAIKKVGRNKRSLVDVDPIELLILAKPEAAAFTGQRAFKLPDRSQDRPVGLGR